MPKPPVYVVVGLARSGVPLLTTALEANRSALEESGIRLPARSEDEMFRAAVEVRREHRAWSLRRKDVEGTWAKLARRATRRLGQDERVVLGHELLAGAASDQIALLVDALAGTAVHVVIVVAAPDPLAGLVPGELDLIDVLTRWESAVKSPDRLHLLVEEPADPGAIWRALGEMVGFDAAALPLADGAEVVAPLDAATLRLLADASYAVLDRPELVDLAEQWAKAAADRGYDVRGDLTALHVPGSGEVRVEALRQALGEAVAEVGRLRERLGQG